MSEDARDRLTELKVLSKEAEGGDKEARKELRRLVRYSSPEVIAEASGIARRAESMLAKTISAGEPLMHEAIQERMRQDFWEFHPTHKVCLVANHKPTVRGTDHAIWRRIKMVPFDEIIPKKEQDPQLPEKLREELPGVLAWAVEGCRQWQS